MKCAQLRQPRYTCDDSIYMNTERDCHASTASMALNRTTEWVKAQASEIYEEASLPPLSASRTLDSGHDGTASSCHEFLIHPVAASPTTTSLVGNMQGTDQEASLDTSNAPPFPCSPPGSGYPVPLQMAPPKIDGRGSERKTFGDVTKKRRPSLLNSIRSLGISTTQRKRREETGRW